MIYSLLKEHAGKKKGLLALPATIDRVGEDDVMPEIEDFPAKPVDLAGWQRVDVERAAKE
jgi:hypothetical protein